MLYNNDFCNPFEKTYIYLYKNSFIKFFARFILQQKKRFYYDDIEKYH